MSFACLMKFTKISGRKTKDQKRTLCCLSNNNNNLSHFFGCTLDLLIPYIMLLNNWQTWILNGTYGTQCLSSLMSPNILPNPASLPKSINYSISASVYLLLLPTIVLRRSNTSVSQSNSNHLLSTRGVHNPQSVSE